MSVDQIKDLIREAGRDPIERDTTYNRVIRDENDFTVWQSGESVDADAQLAGA